MVFTESCGCFRGVFDLFQMPSPSAADSGRRATAAGRSQEGEVGVGGGAMLGRNNSTSTSATASVLDEPGSFDFCGGRTRLTQAVVVGDALTAAKLLAGGADPNETDMLGVGPLKLAVEGGSLELVEVLLEYGANPLQRRREEEERGDLSPLQTAASLKLHDIYSVLLEYAAGMHAANNPFSELFK